MTVPGGHVIPTAQMLGLQQDHDHTGEGHRETAAYTSEHSPQEYTNASDDEQYHSSSSTPPSPKDFGDATPSDVADYWAEKIKPNGNASGAVLEEHQADVMDDASGCEHNSASDPIVTAEDFRAEGLCHDYLLEDPRNMPYLLTPPELLAAELEDPAGSPESRFNAALDLYRNGEKWEVDRESAGFLASVIALGRDDGQPIKFRDERASLSECKVDEPILKHDPELELQRLRRRNVAVLNTCGMQPFELDVERDEAIEWPTHIIALPSELDQQIADEKLVVEQEVAEYIRDLAMPNLMSTEEMMSACIESDRPPIVQALTPPLLPLSPLASPPTLPDDLMEMELTSTPEDLMAKEAAQLRQQIMERDEYSVATIKAADPMDMLSSLQTPGTSSSTPGKHTRLADLRAEVPLLPNETSSSTVKGVRTASFPKEMHSLIPLPDSDNSIFDDSVANQDLDAFVSDFVVPFAESAIAQADNEELFAVDTIARVPVPQIDEAKPILPWLAFTGQGLLSYTKRESLSEGDHKWAGVSKLERTLSWTPFAAWLGKVSVAEELDDDRSAQRYMAELDFGGEVDIRSLISHTEGLRTLDDCESDEDELEPVKWEEDHPLPAQPTKPSVSRAPLPQSEAGPTTLQGPEAVFQAQPPPPEPDQAQAQVLQKNAMAERQPTQTSGQLDMSALLRKRKLELEKPASSITEANGDATHMTNPSRKLQKTSDAATMSSKPGAIFADVGLTGFMHLQGGPVKAASRPAETMQPKQAAAPAAVTVAPAKDIEPEALPAAITPHPQINDPKAARQIVIGRKLLADRVFTRELQCLLPGLELIERDSLPLGAGGKRSDEEADIILSPSSGLLSTTLQKLRQKPLPGQTAYFGIRERIAALALRHETLIVLIGGGSSLDERDCETLSELAGFVAGIDAEIEIRFAPGGDDSMTKWIAATISQHSLTGNDSIRLLQDETLWERFLRSAGMNAYAAQVVLARLKAPDGLPSSEDSSVPESSTGVVFGLAAFVRMTFDELVQLFGAMLGGERVLRRVSDAIDNRWMSAAARLKSR